MIVRQFLQWIKSASAAERADAAAALARAYLYSDLGPDDRAAAEGALIMLLDDPSPLVRIALARALAFSEEAPPSVILGLAADQPQVASLVLEHSPLLLDTDLVEAATREPRLQITIARRQKLPASVSATIAEVGSAKACLALLENERAEIVAFSFGRILDRFGQFAAVREALLLRQDLPAPTRQVLVARVSEMLADFVAEREWLGKDRAKRVAKEACEKATVILAGAAPETEMRPLILHLRESGQLNAGLMLRALLSGNLEMFLQALSELSGMPIARVSALVYDRGSAGMRALFERAGLPRLAYPAFHEAIEALREGGFDPGGTSRLKRRMVERVLTRCAEESDIDTASLITLLRRFASEAAREEARLFCEELAQGEPFAFDPMYEREAA
jgi:uncharacterized protein (DUF2336 family)